MQPIPSTAARPFGRGVSGVVLLAVLCAAGGAAMALADEPPAAARGLFPDGSRFVAVPMDLTRDQRNLVRERAGVRVRPRRIKAWRVAGDGGWLFVDEVLGKHEFITYAVAIDRDGRVTGVEILEYRESYGGEIQRASWRRQFHGRRVTDGLRFGRDVDGISGATLSARNVTDGVRKLLVLREFLDRRDASGG